MSGLAAGLGPVVPNRSEIVRLLQGVQIVSSRDPSKLHNAVFVCRDGFDHLFGRLIAEQAGKHWPRLDPSCAAQCATCGNRNGSMEVIQQIDQQWHDFGMRSD